MSLYDRAQYNKNHTFGVWQRSVIRKILTNRTYIGTWEYGKTGKDYEPVPIEVPAVVSTDVFEEAQKNRPRANTKKYTYLLTGFSSCICGRRITGSAIKRENGGINFYYRCSYSNTGGSCINKKYYRVDQLDNPIWEWISNEIADPKKLESRLRDYQENQRETFEPIHNELSLIGDLITKQNKQRAKWLELFASEFITKTELEEKLPFIARTIDSLTNQQVALERRLTNLMNEDSLENILKLSADIRDEIQHIDSVEARRKIVEALDVTVRLEEDDRGNIIAKARACIGTNSYMLSERKPCNLKDNITNPDAREPLLLAQRFLAIAYYDKEKHQAQLNLQ